MGSLKAAVVGGVAGAVTAALLWKATRASTVDFSRKPDLEVASAFNAGEIMPLHTTYWVAGSGGGNLDPTLVQGCHALVDDAGVKVLRLQSLNRYQVGFGDHVIGYGPPGSHGSAPPESLWDIADRVCGQPPYYFGWRPSQPPMVDALPFTPAYWGAELDVLLKVPAAVGFAVDHWIWYGIDPQASPDWPGLSQGTNLWYDNVTRGLYYAYGNYPNTPYARLLKADLTLPTDYFRIRFQSDYSRGISNIMYADLNFEVPLTRERTGGKQGDPPFGPIDFTLTSIGELSIKSYVFRCWNKI